eukprot:2513380-Amphidinium_carterae.1
MSSIALAEAANERNNAMKATQDEGQKYSKMVFGSEASLPMVTSDSLEHRLAIASALATHKGNPFKT